MPSGPVEDTLGYLMDMNGPRGGVDKLCQITIRAHRVGDVVVRETGTTVAAPLNRAEGRVSIDCLKHFVGLTDRLANLFGPER